MGGPIVLTRTHQGEELGIDDNRGEELSTGLHQLDIFLVEAARLDGLDHQNTGGPTLHHQRGCQEGRESLLTGLREISEPVILPSSLKSNGLAMLRDPTDQTIPHAQPNMADRGGVKPDGGAQEKRLGLRLTQIDRTHVCIETFGNQIGHIRQRLLQVMRAGDDLSDIGKD